MTIKEKDMTRIELQRDRERKLDIA